MTLRLGAGLGVAFALLAGCDAFSSTPSNEPVTSAKDAGEIVVGPDAGVATADSGAVSLGDGGAEAGSTTDAHGPIQVWTNSSIGYATTIAFSPAVPPGNVLMFALASISSGPATITCDNGGDLPIQKADPNGVMHLTVVRVTTGSNSCTFAFAASTSWAVLATEWEGLGVAQDAQTSSGLQSPASVPAVNLGGDWLNLGILAITDVSPIPSGTYVVIPGATAPENGSAPRAAITAAYVTNASVGGSTAPSWSYNGATPWAAYSRTFAFQP